MADQTSGEQVAANTDRELFREDTGDPAGPYYEDSLHVTAQGAIGMNVGGRVLTAPIFIWHQALHALDRGCGGMPHGAHGACGGVPHAAPHPGGEATALTEAVRAAFMAAGADIADSWRPLTRAVQRILAARLAADRAAATEEQA